MLLANSILTWHDGQGSRPNFTPSEAVNVYLFNNFIKIRINIGGVFNENTNVFSTSNYYFNPPLWIPPVVITVYLTNQLLFQAVEILFKKDLIILLV